MPLNEWEDKFLIQNFWNKIVFPSDLDIEKCWYLNTRPSGDGYGQYQYKTVRYVASRLSYILHTRTQIDGKLILHKCDNPICINPEHLFIGSPDDNSKDMVKKDRQAKGERVGTHKLTDWEISDIRGFYSFGNYSQRQLAKLYGVSQHTIMTVTTNKHWRHLD